MFVCVRFLLHVMLLIGFGPGTCSLTKKRGILLQLGTNWTRRFLVASLRLCQLLVLISVNTYGNRSSSQSKVNYRGSSETYDWPALMGAMLNMYA